MKINKIAISVFFVLVSITILSCKKKSTATQAELDEKIITNYISDNNLNATATGSGLYYVMTTVGTGVQPNSNSNVTVSYRGSLKGNYCIANLGFRCAKNIN